MVFIGEGKLFDKKSITRIYDDMLTVVFARLFWIIFYL